MTAAADKSPVADQTQPGLMWELDRRFRRPLLTYFGRRVASPSEAQDLTQDVFERVLRGFGSTSIANVEALVFRIAVNLLRDRARRQRSRGAEEPLTTENLVEYSEALAVDLSPERVVLGERTLADVLTALEELSERTRAIFYLYRLENLKIREIAEFYGVSTSAVEKHVSKALLHLARHLDRE